VDEGARSDGAAAAPSAKAAGSVIAG